MFACGGCKNMESAREPMKSTQTPPLHTLVSALSAMRELPTRISVFALPGFILENNGGQHFGQAW